MSDRRKSLSQMAPVVGPVPEIPVREEPSVPPPAAAAEPVQRSPRRPQNRRETAAGRDGVRPAARDLVTPAREHVPREALKADVPSELDLIRRLHRYRLDNNVDMRDQVAMAVDEWLTRHGY
jgi:hypothetical protein